MEFKVTFWSTQCSESIVANYSLGYNPIEGTASAVTDII